jgi:hypothetical protein
MMARLVMTGPYKGHPIRKAKKAFVCLTFLGVNDAGKRIHCRRQINVGDHYVEGDSNLDVAGGFGHDKLCFFCARVETMAELADALLTGAA